MKYHDDKTYFRMCVCGHKFHTKNKTRVYCSKACRTAMDYSNKSYRALPDDDKNDYLEQIRREVMSMDR